MKIVPTTAGRVISGLLLGALVISMLRLGREIWLVEQSRTWPAVDGEVVGFATLEPRPISGYPDQSVICYRYRVNEKVFEGWRVSFSRRTKWYQNDLHELMSRYQHRQTVKVFYQPSDPENAVLEPGGNNAANWTMLTLQIVVFGVLAWWIVRAGR